MAQRDFNDGATRLGNDQDRPGYSVWTSAPVDARPEASSLSDAQLLDYLKRSLAGEPFPLSAPRNPAGEMPLAMRVRGILRAENENARLAPPLAESLPEIEASRPSEATPPLPTALAYPVEADLPFLAAIPLRRRSNLGWGSTALILFMTLGAAYIPSLFASPPRYAAEARLEVQGAARAIPGFLDAATQRLTSPRLLSQVVTRLKLDRDDEFTGGEATAYSVVKDLFTDSGAAADGFSRAQTALRQRLSVTPDARSGSLALVVQSSDPKTSARIANDLADAAVRDAAAKPPLTPNAAEQAMESERKTYDAANAALTAFKARTGDDKIAAASELMARREALGHQLAAADKEAQAASIRLTAAKSVKMSDVLDGAISPDLGSPAVLEDLRNRYAAARTTLGQLSTQLGPRHPRLLAAQSVLDALSASMTTEIRKIVVAADADVKSAASQARLLKDRAAELDRQPTSVDLVAFGKLQADVETARQAYETALTATQDVQPDVKSVAPLALVAPAVPATLPVEDNRLGRTLISAAIGFGMALALIGFRFLMSRKPRHTSFDEDALDLEMADLLADVRQAAPFRAPLDQPLQRFNAGIPVANDRLTEIVEQQQPAPETALTAIIDDVASLRERVATYAMRRHAAGR
ncbi:hypothetical protein [Rhizobium sp. HT1-10]|uniref:hypothetical protein n=1 Tax=Rhizobium sp. HT1-10 TaxID=3111638 RepID=UPI003C21B356